MSQHFGNQLDNNRATPGGDGSSNKTPPEINATDDDNDDEEVDVVDPKGINNASSSKWGAQEDDALVSAWIHCAIDDPEKATNQTLRDMWKSIYDLYELARVEKSSIIQRRTLRAMKGRWGRINKELNIWVGCYAEAQRRNGSGTNNHNVMTDAQEMYRAAQNGARFTLLSVWEELRKCDKWRPTNKQVPETSESGSSKRSESDTLTDDGRRGRPDGVKMAKRKGKSVASSGINSLDSFTQALSKMNMMKEQYLNVDEKRADVAKQMLDYQKERDVMKRQRKEEKKRFKLFSVLLAKSHLTEDDEKLLQKLKEEFSHLLG
ncbi:glutathione S-transferase T2-like [Chenopodium quinoa]|uniref:glutathione S-transferase T2-like n=1 Tax=Chenopodium quinoa TaxID=63459 RepID=UPI000B7816CD|nr:glutathione S-transferase T2-like [Chenopodium quinoa]